MTWKTTFHSDITPTAGAMERLTEDQRLKVQLVASLMLDAFDGGDWPLAKEHWTNADFDADEHAACWSYFDSKQRAYLSGANRKYLDGV